MAASSQDDRSRARRRAPRCVSAAGLRRLRDRPEASARALGALPRGQLELLAVAKAIAAEPVTLICNAALAATAGAIQRGGDGMIVQAMHRPWSTKRAAVVDDPRMPLPWGHVEGRWRAGGNETRFALFSDRPERPAPRREALLGEWRQSYAEIRPDGEPVLLVLCPSAYERTLWLELYERVGASLPPIGFALQRDVCQGYGLDDRVWQPASAYEPRSLRELLTWSRAPADEPVCRADEGNRARRLPRLPRRDEALRPLLNPPARSGPQRRVAACALGLNRAQLLIVRLLVTQPWLSAADIASVRGEPVDAVNRHLAALRETGAAVAVPVPGHNPLWVLTETGMQLAAARAGDARQWRSFAQRTGLPRPQADGLPRRPRAHDIGVSRMLGLLAAAARSAGLWLDDWRSEIWWLGDVSTEAPVPDAAFRLRRPRGEPIVGLVEYERLRGGRQGPDKVEPWVEWYRQEKWRDLRGPLHVPGAAGPVLLFVYDPAGSARATLRRALEQAPAGIPMFAASEEQLAVRGLHAPIWLRAGGGVGPAVAPAAA